jgi:hypothetical protein
MTAGSQLPGPILLFDRFERTDTTPKRYIETMYGFYNRHKSEAISKIRHELERWFAKYPSDAQAEFQSRFKDRIEPPFFELFLHELFLRTASTVCVHPNVKGTDRRPDFGIRPPSAPTPILVEATVWLDEVGAHVFSPLIGSLYDAINAMESPHWRIHVLENRLLSGRQPSARNVIAFLKEKMAGFDPASGPACDLVNGMEHYNDGDIEIDFSFSPKAKPSKFDRNIGMYPTDVRWGEGAEAVRKKLAQKVYGDLGLPYVIAFNDLSWWGGDGQNRFHEILFGAVQESVAATTGELVIRRLNDGFWGTAAQP